MPIGYLFGTVLIAWCTAMALAPIRRPRRLARLSWISSMVINEQSHLAVVLLGISTGLAFAEGDIDSGGAWAVVALSAATVAGNVALTWRATGTRRVVERAISDGLEGVAGDEIPMRRSWPRILIAPWLMWRGDVERLRNIAYGDARHQRLDIYRHRSRPDKSPVLVYFHGGGFTGGGKSREARAQLYRLASEGWLCISANYRTARIRPDSFPGSLIDAKRVIKWVRSEGAGFGANPDEVLLAGSSAGAHLSAMAALTVNDPRLQPGFERADTSVTAAVCLYGYYGRVGGGDRRPDTDVLSSPFDHLRPNAPPVLIAHGDHDTFTSVERARCLADAWRSAGSNHVVYVELPGAQHSFDIFHSIRFDTLVEGILVFASWARDREAARGAARKAASH